MDNKFCKNCKCKTWHWDNGICVRCKTLPEIKEKKQVNIEVLIDYYMQSVYPNKTYKQFTFDTDGMVTIIGMEK